MAPSFRHPLAQCTTGQWHRTQRGCVHQRRMCTELCSRHAHAPRAQFVLGSVQGAVFSQQPGKQWCCVCTCACMCTHRAIRLCIARAEEKKAHIKPNAAGARALAGRGGGCARAQCSHVACRCSRAAGSRGLHLRSSALSQSAWQHTCNLVARALLGSRANTLRATRAQHAHLGCTPPTPVSTHSETPLKDSALAAACSAACPSAAPCATGWPPPPLPGPAMGST